MSSPAQRSIALLKKEGYATAIVERYNSFIKRRIDLYGFIDIVALHPDKTGILGIQTTTAAHLANRITKAKAIPYYDLWLQAGNKLEFHGWAKKGARGKRKLWEVNRVYFPPLDKG